MRADALEYVWSDMLVSEAGQNPSPDTREKVLAWRDRASAYVPVTPDIERHAAEIMRRGVKTVDALHLACAASAGCDWFFTVDKGIYNKVDRIGAMRVANPLDFVKEAE